MARTSREFTVYKTAVFKIHKPSQRRRSLLADCLRRADAAFWRAMERIELSAKALVGQDPGQKYLGLRKLKRELESWLSKLPLSGVQKSGVLCDALGLASSHIALAELGESPSWPEKDRTQDSYADGLERLSKSTTLEEYNEGRRLLERRRADAPPRPLTIIQNDTLSRSAMLLKDDHGRLFAWINTHSTKSRYARTVRINGLKNVRTGEVIEARSKAGELFPLEGSKWHTDVFIEQGRMQSARVSQKDGEFYFAATFGFVSEPVEPVTVIGIDRGIENLAAWAIINADGSVVTTGRFDGVQLREFQRKAEGRMKRTQKMGRTKIKRWRGFADQTIYRLAKEIVALAVTHKAQVILEDLASLTRPRGNSKNSCRRYLTRAQYQKLARVLEYKLQERGLPRPREVEPAYTSISCPECGHKDKANRPAQAEFICQQCGLKRHADENAAVNIALKWVWICAIEPSWLGKDGKIKSEFYFNAWLATR